MTRRRFCRSIAGLGAGSALLESSIGFGQIPGERPARPEGVTMLNPRARVPVGVIIDDSTTLVNLNRFAMPQFDAAFAGANPAYHKPWQEWPVEIPDAFVRKFGDWANTHGVKGKYSVVPFPACVGRIDRLLPGWSHQQLQESIELVRTLLVPGWDIHPEMVTHTRVIDLKTGHPFPDQTLKFMENWDWTTGRSADEIGAYLAYALRILQNVGFVCEGITTPGGFAGRARPELAQAAWQAVREVYRAEIPHYFKYLIDSGDASVAPRVENAGGLEGADPRCVVSIVACTGDWTGGWDCSEPVGADRFITPDLQRGRMVEVIERGEPALILAHWTGFYWNGQERGFAVLQEVVRRLHARFDHLRWMKLSELARYWAARELTRIERQADRLIFRAPFACPDLTLRFGVEGATRLVFRGGTDAEPLREVAGARQLEPGRWCRDGAGAIVCLPLPRGKSELEILK